MTLIALLIVSFAQSRAELERAGQISTSEVQGSTETTGFRIIPLLGFTAYTVQGDSTEAVRSENGVSGGALFDYGSGRSRVESGLLYLQGGFRVPLPYGLNWSLEASYLGIPITGKYMIYKAEEAGPSGVHVKGGLIPAWLLSSTMSVTDRGYVLASKRDFGDLNRFDLIATGGVGYTTDRYWPSLLVELSLFRGLIPITKEASIYNAGMTFSIGVPFHL